MRREAGHTERASTGSGKAESQSEAMAFLLDPATYGGAAVDHMETHMSHVFLVGEFAYKMKKAVRLDFVDFTLLEDRRRASEREIEINRRTAPDIYLGVVAVNREDGRLALGPPTSAIDYLVKMRRFDQADLLDRVATEGRLSSKHVRELADAIAALHLSAARVANPRETEDFEVTARTLAARLKAHADDPRAAAAVRSWVAKMDARLAVLAPLIRARARRGAVRHCHGDLHLRNICLFRGEVRLFDAIEFEPKFSHIDVLYDLAFVLMDLRHRAADAEATALLGRYLGPTRDYSGIALLRLFISVRAAVRALVALLDLAAGKLDEALTYLGQAEAALSEPAGPRLVAIGGRSGTGKSTLAHALAPLLADAPNVVVIRSDEARKRIFGVAPETPLPPAAYEPSVADRVYRRLFRDARRALDANAVVVLDATFLEPDSRDGALRVAREAGASFTGLWLSAKDDVLARRLKRRSDDASDADIAVLSRQRDAEETPGWTCLNAGQEIERMCAVARDAIHPQDESV